MGDALAEASRPSDRSKGAHVASVLRFPFSGRRRTGRRGPDPPFVVCHDQSYALCATANCTVYNGVAYCRCDVLTGDSISLQFAIPTPTGEANVCDVMAQGTTLGFLVSTYSYPADAAKGGSLAIYTCPGTDNAAGGVPPDLWPMRWRYLLAEGG